TSSTARITAEPTAPSAERITYILYPNPTPEGKVYLQPALPYDSYLLMNLAGRIVRNTFEAGVLKELDLSGLASGVYILISQGPEGCRQFKIIKQ
ncbi:T9SS type A sorting domain-containing protein, partial [Larkinella soli]|uniref:T9SS type A sorting domain-containing protein n=1 Tax=Larkinella soli TaxID=1770527 RepID=UPI0013E32E38